MILFELFGTENNPAYRSLEASNAERHYSFLLSTIDIAVQTQQFHLSTALLKALNYHAIACLHTSGGAFRPCEVCAGERPCPQAHRVSALMDTFVNQVNSAWHQADAIALATYILWRVNYIHPFINGNGRTARAAAYFALCVKSGGALPGPVILPELIKQNRDEYVEALKVAHASYEKGQQPDLSVLQEMVGRLANEQIAAADE
ncbi:MAG: Fic family protein [Pseudomonadota bacterium]